MTNQGAVLTALADPTRRAIFERLARSPGAVGELARELPVSRPAVSQHLKILKSAGLVTDRAAGTRRVYPAGPRRDPRLLRAVLAAVPGQVRGCRQPADSGGPMTTQTQATSVTTSTEVQEPIEHAFRVFTARIGTWRNPDHHILR